MSATVPSVTRWWQYVRTVAATASQAEIAESAGVSQPTVSRWAKGEIERATADAAVRFALAYGASVGEALVAAGVLDGSQLPVTITRYDQPDDEALLALLAQRLRRDRGEGEGSGQQPAATKNAGDPPATPQGLTEEERAILTLARELDDSQTVGDLRTAAAGIAAGNEPNRGDYTLAALDRDDSAEIEAQQNEP